MREETTKEKSRRIVQRISQDANRVVQNQIDLDYAPEFKAILNLEYFGYILQGISKYLQVNEKALKDSNNQRKLEIYLSALAELQNTSIGLDTGK